MWNKLIIQYFGDWLTSVGQTIQNAPEDFNGAVVYCLKKIAGV